MASADEGALLAHSQHQASEQTVIAPTQSRRVSESGSPTLKEERSLNSAEHGLSYHSPEGSPPVPTSLKNGAGAQTLIGEMRRRTNGDASTCPPATAEGVPVKSPILTFRSLRRATTSLLTPTHKLGPAPSMMESLKSIFLSSWLNILLVFVPLSWALHFALPHSFGQRDTVIFVCAFLAIIPLAKLLAFATDELSMRVGQTLAGLMNATLGNAVELIVAIIALVKCELRIVQASLVGSILSNLLLVLGMCFFAGGLKFSEQGFGVSATQLNSSLLTISVIAVLLPAAFHFSVGSPSGDTTFTPQQEEHDILAVSHGVAIILLVVYAGYLWFQLVSHTVLYADKGDHVLKSTQYAHGTRRFGLPPKKKNLDSENVTATIPPSTVGRSTTLNGSQRSAMEYPMSSLGTQMVDEPSAEGQVDEEEEETPQMSLLMTIILLIAVTVLVAVTAEFLVDSVDGLTASGHISKEFVGIILLPIVGNAAEHATAVTVSVKDKLTLSLGVAVGSSIQIALFVIPFIVILGWILGKPLSMLFDPYESIAMFLSVLTVNYVVQDGKSNWLEGFILMGLYVILAVTFWYYPGSVEQFSCH